MPLTACYDLSVSPPTYDCVGFLPAAEMERMRLGCDTLSVEILPGPRDGFRNDSLPPFGAWERRAMLNGIVVPMTALLPSCTGCTVRTGRTEPPSPSFGYKTPRYGFSPMLRAARANVYPFRATPAKTGYVTITLREASHWPARNSRIAEWLKTARWIRHRGVRAIVVRDTEKADEPIEDLETDPAASRNLAARASLYAGAEFNLFVNNGPAWLCMFLGVPCFIFNLTPKFAPGLEPGSSWPNAKRRQGVFWMDDRSENVIRAIEQAA